MYNWNSNVTNQQYLSAHHQTPQMRRNADLLQGITPTNLPHVEVDSSVSQVLESNIPNMVNIISSSTINQIQNYAADETKLGRVNSFNILSINKFQNKEYYNVVDFICKFMLCKLQTERNDNVQEIMHSCIEHTLIGVSSVHMTMNARVFDTLLPQEKPEVSRMAAEFNGTYDSVNNYFSRSNQPITNQHHNPYQNQQQQQQFNNSGMGTVFNHNRGDNRFNGPHTNVANGVSNTLFSSSQPIPHGMHTSDTSNRYNGQMNQPKENIPIVQSLPKAIEETAPVVKPPRNGTFKVITKPPRPRLRLKTYNPNIHESIEIVDEDGIKENIIKQKEEDMKTETKDLPNVTHIEGVSSKETKSRTAAVELTVMEGIADPTSLVMTNEVHIHVVQSVDELADLSIIDLHKNKTVNSRYGVSRIYGTLIKSCITDIDLTAWLRGYLDTSIHVFHGTLQAESENILSKKECKLDYISLNFCNNRITEKVNIYLKDKLNLAGITIDSFISDWVDLINVLKTTLTPSELIDFNLDMDGFLSVVFHEADQASYDWFKSITLDQYVSKDEECGLKLNAYSENTMLCTIPLYAKELCINDVKDIPYSVSEEHTKLLYNLCLNMYLFVEENNIRTDIVILNTLDGVKYKVMCTKDNYSIRRY